MHCLNCGYSLKDLREAKCPECGREFDPRNAKTYGDSSPLRFAAAQTTGTIAATVALLVLCVCPIGGGHGGFILGFQLFTAPPVTLSVIGWLVLCIFAGTVKRPGIAALFLSICIGILLLSWGLVMLVTDGGLYFWSISAAFLAACATSIAKTLRLLTARRQYQFGRLAEASVPEEVVVLRATDQSAE